MKGSPEVIATLQAALAAEAQLNLQYRMDWRSLKFMGVKKVAHDFKDLGDDVHYFMKKINDRILFLGGTPSYQIGKISEQTNVTGLFQNALAMEMAIVAPYEQAIQVAMKALDDTSRNAFEHFLKWHEKNISYLEQQLALIKGLGGEAEYIAEKL